ncbi:MAG TPA: carboxypeptidase regulatory-like domain-containing protein [Vicinamibacterales bacterium]
MMRALASRIGVVLVLVLVPVAAMAQTSSIAGTVRDASGAVLPGVTVEASSPVLIEKVRTGVTDGSGLYRVENLRPGTYLVTFSLAGFSLVKREGIEITSDFTATVNAEMKVGTLEETITVTGESPVVDTQSITQRTVMTREVLDAIPTGRNIQAVGIMIPGTALSLGGGGALSRDVGGSAGMQQSPLILRGSTDAVQTIEGMRLNNLEANGSYSGVYWNDGSFQEFSYVTGADSAEMAQGGVRINLVPRDGGNTFRGAIVGNYSGDGWQANNLRDNLRGSLAINPNNRITNVSMIRKIWDFNPGFGGPIAKDKLWFYGTFRHWGVDKTVVDSYFDGDPAPYRYAPDLSQPGIDDSHIVSRAGRVSWQATSKDRLAYYHDDQSKYRNHWGISASISPEAAAVQVTPTSYVSVSKWTRTQTSKLLLEGGFSIYSQEYTELYQPLVTGIDRKVFDLDAIAASTVYSITEQTTSRVFNAWNAPADHFSTLRTYSGAASYITGSHSLRFGGAASEGPRRTLQRYTGDLTMTFNNGLPQSVTLRTPLDQREGIKADVGVFAQDRWTINRATINAGVRFDWFQGQVLDEDLPAGRWSPAAHFDAFDVQDWKDLSPRLGLAYDLFGNGKTAIKFSIARYVNGEAAGTAAANNPQTTVGRTDTRTWTDNGDFTIFNADGTVQSNELGPSTSSTFGKLVPSTTSTDPKVLSGWFVRPNNWEYTISMQHELMPRVALTAGYYRRSFGNQTVIDNQLTDASSYDGPFCITAPTNADLPGGGGYQVCGLYDIKPTSQGQVRNVRRLASDFNGISDVFSGFDVNVNARLRQGTIISGGVNAQRRIYDNCNAPLAAAVPGVVVAAFGAGSQQVDSPEARFCKQTFPFRPDVKLLASHRLPWSLQVSGTYQFTQGPNILATWAAPNSTILPALGRNLAAGATATKTIQLVEPGTQYGQHLNQLDFRISKSLSLDRYRVKVDADLYNVFNSNWPFTVNNTFTTAATSQWLRPTNVLQGRLFKIGAQFDF